MGMFLAKPAKVPRKSPNRTMMPYSSTAKPIRGHLNRIRASPAKKAAVPFAFCFRAKNKRVFCGPIMIVSPMRKRIWRRTRQSLFRRQGSGGRCGLYISHGEPAGKVPCCQHCATCYKEKKSKGLRGSHCSVKELHHSADEEEAS